MDDPERSASACPTLAHFLEVFDTMNDVAPSILIWQVEQMDCASRMHNIYGDITYLS
jgi:hypothetical protein